MKRISILALCLFLAVVGVSAAFANNGGDEGPLKMAADGKQIHQVFTGVNNGMMKAGTDTFYLYGGPSSFTDANVHPTPANAPENLGPWPLGMFSQYTSALAPGTLQVQGWTSEDLTRPIVHWHGSTIWADATAGGVAADSLFTGTGSNQVVASHHQKVPGSNDYSGYGNLWKDWLVFQYDMSNANPVVTWNPGDPVNVKLTAEYKCDLEHCCDYLMFEYEWAGNDVDAGWHSVADLDVSTFGDDPNNPGTDIYKARLFDSEDPNHDGAAGAITYPSGRLLGGTNISLRIQVFSDSGWSDEDGRPSGGGTYPRGGAFVDNIHVYVDANGSGFTQVSFADWEGATITDQAEGTILGLNNGGYPGKGGQEGTAGWTPESASYCGDFSHVIPSFIEGDIDVCRENNTPMLSFINTGTQVAGVGPSVQSSGTPYGLPPDYYVFEYQGGLLAPGIDAVYNKFESPVIRVNPAGSTATNGGFWMGFTIWSDLPPVPNFIMWRWSVRSHTQAGGWTPWNDCTYHYYGASVTWSNQIYSITDKIVSGADSMQVAFMGRDASLAFTGSPSPNATAAPEFDNVWVKRFEIGGPSISVPANSLFNDSFPPDGTTTSAVRMDPGANIGGTGSTTTVYVPQDSLAVEVKPIIAGTSLVDFGQMYVAHMANPAYAWNTTVRPGINDILSVSDAGTASSLAAAAADLAHPTWHVYTYYVNGQQCTLNGSPVADNYYFDLPDGPVDNYHGTSENALVFPGDVLHYYLEFDDNASGWSTAPGAVVVSGQGGAPVSSFTDFSYQSTWSRQWSMRALPSNDGGSTQPGVLWWNDVDSRGNDNEIVQAFAQNGMLEGRDYDTYVTKGASSGMGNGLGSNGEHGATAGQLSGYDCLFYTMQTLREPALSNGQKGTDGNDWSDDVGLLTLWHDQDADRHAAFFGENFADAMHNQAATDPATETFMSSYLGVQWVNDDLNFSHNLDDQVASVVVPTGNGNSAGKFVTSYSPYGGCLVINDWDQIQAVGGAVVAHVFTDPSGAPYTTPRVASVYYDRLDGTATYRKVDVTFPYDPLYIRDEFTNPQNSGPITARGFLFGELLSAFDCTVGTPAVGTSALPKKLVVSQNYPNPFNPSTTIKYSMPVRGQVSIKVYNLRGSLVTTLVDGIQDAGEHNVIWSGKDNRGASVSTGIYLYKVKTLDSEIVKKMALIK